MLPRGDTLSRGRFIECKCDANGNPVGQPKENTLIDSQHYLVEFEDGEVTEFTSNIIVQSIYMICVTRKENVFFFFIVFYISSVKKSMTLTDQKFVTSCGKDHNYRSTKGWQLFYQWKNGSTSCQKLYDFKNFYLVQTANYAITEAIYHEPVEYWFMINGFCNSIVGSLNEIKILEIIKLLT